MELVGLEPKKLTQHQDLSAVMAARIENILKLMLAQKKRLRQNCLDHLEKIIQSR